MRKKKPEETSLNNEKKYYVFAVEILEKYLKKISAEISGTVKADDIEHVHRMRVATRRLRTAMELFKGCFQRKTLRCFKKILPRITNTLGAARDTDVQIEYLTGVLRKNKNVKQRQGIKFIINKLKTKRKDLQPQIISCFDKLEKDNFFEIAGRRLKIALIECEIRELKKRGEKQAEKHNALAMIRAAAADSTKNEKFLSLPENEMELHDMRKKFKHLRYSVEIFKSFYGDNADFVIETIKQIQEYLGEIHDLDVFVSMVGFYLQYEEKAASLAMNADALLENYSKYKPGFEYLVKLFRIRRSRALKKLIDFWTEISAGKFWDIFNPSFAMEN